MFKCGYLHSVHSLRWRLTLRATEVLVSLLGEALRCQGTVRHRVLVHAILFEVGHHVGQSCLCCRFRSFLLDLVHLFQVFFSRRIQFVIEAFLGLRLERSGLRLGDLVDLESTSHGRVHHDLPRCLNLLKAVEGHIVEVACAIEVPLLISHDLFKENISASLALFLLQQEVVSRGDLIVFVVLDVSYGLAQVAIGTDA